MGKPFDPFEDRRRQQMQEVRRNEVSAEEAYKQGVTEASRVPVIFVDPDNIREIDMRFSQRPPYVRNPGYSLEQQLNRQVPGAASAVLDRANEGSTDRVSMNQIARAVRESGPAALSRVMINGQEYGLIIMPNRQFDSKEDMVHDMFDHLDRDTRRAILRNTPGTDAQWMRFIGNHEGEHLNDHTPRTNSTQTLAEEVRADRSAHSMALARGEGDIALAWRDMRALRAFGDPTHATNPLMSSQDRVEYQHINSASNSLADMSQAVQNNFDWANYAGKARTPEDLLKENPEAYFGVVRQHVQDIETTAMAAYNTDPASLPAQRAVIDAQIKVDYMRDFEDAWRRRVLGQPVPERAPTQLITQEQEDNYFKEAAFQARMSVEQGQIQHEAIAAFPDDRIFAGVDLSAEGEGIETSGDLWNANPVRFHEIAQERLNVLKDEALAAHAADPSYENLERLVQLEQIIDTNEFSLGYERHRAANPAETTSTYTPGPPVTIISDEQRRSYYEERIARKDAGTWTAPAAWTPPPVSAMTPDPIYALPGVIPEAESLVAADALIAYNDEVVFAGVDWDQVDGPATSADELFVQDPKLYNEIAAQRLQAMSEGVLADYRANPSYETLEKVVQIEMAMNQTNTFLAAHQATDPSAPYQEPALVSLISEGERAGYYHGRMQMEALKTAPAEAAPETEIETSEAGAETPAEPAVEEGAETTTPAPTGGGVEASPDGASEAAAPKDYQQGVDGTAYTAVVRGLPMGEPIVNFDAEKRISVGGLSMGTVFGQSADPDPLAVSMVNAREPAVQPLLAEENVDITPMQFRSQSSGVSMQAPA